MRMPDPSTKMLRSGFGSQVRSTSPSEPSFGFGTSVRDASLRVRQKEAHGSSSERTEKQLQCSTLCWTTACMWTLCLLAGLVLVTAHPPLAHACRMCLFVLPAAIPVA